MNGAERELIFIGLSLSSSWGNGHATTYRALLRDNSIKPSIGKSSRKILNLDGMRSS